MKVKTIALALAASSALLAAAPAFADPPHWAAAHGWRAKQPHARHYHPYYGYRAPAYVLVPARPVYVVPPPVIYAPPPRPVFYGTVPVSPGVQIGFRVGL
jgi:hypothetical protein